MDIRNDIEFQANDIVDPIMECSKCGWTTDVESDMYEHAASYHTDF